MGRAHSLALHLFFAPNDPWTAIHAIELNQQGYRPLASTLWNFVFICAAAVNVSHSTIQREFHLTSSISVNSKFHTHSFWNLHHFFFLV